MHLLMLLVYLIKKLSWNRIIGGAYISYSYQTLTMLSTTHQLKDTLVIVSYWLQRAQTSSWCIWRAIGSSVEQQYWWLVYLFHCFDMLTTRRCADLQSLDCTIQCGWYADNVRHHKQNQRYSYFRGFYDLWKRSIVDLGPLNPHTICSVGNKETTQSRNAEYLTSLTPARLLSICGRPPPNVIKRRCYYSL